MYWKKEVGEGGSLRREEEWRKGQSAGNKRIKE